MNHLQTSLHLRNIKQRGLNIEGTPRCTLECSMCKRTTYQSLHNTKVVPGNDLTPDDLKRILKFFKGEVSFSGQLSDPIFNPHLVELLTICKEQEVKCRVNTAATGRKEGWYENAFLANSHCIWTFGIDGPPHLSHNYRVNQNGVFLYKMMKMARSMGIKTYWQYIIFDYNKEYIKECKALAKRYAIKIEFIKTRRGMEDE